MNSDFASLGLSPALLSVCAELGYSSMTSIQAESIPPLLAGKDLIGQSKTGSGKTAAFALPILERMHIERRSIQALVLCPTRELCAQVAREIRKLGRRHPGLQVLTVSGGEPIHSQIRSLAKGVHLVVGTPGRVIDHLGRKTIRLRRTGTVVLDEADRMLDMGFEEDMKRILSEIPESRQTVFFSATFPPSIEAMSAAYQKDAVRVQGEEPDAGNPDIKQVAIKLERGEKTAALCDVLGACPHESALIFCNTKATVAELLAELKGRGVSVGSLHGDLEQFDRDRVMAQFRNQSLRILVATDVAARGIDVVGLDLVINFDLPSQADDYVHRIGRTGRAGKEGLAISFVTPRELPKLPKLEAVTGSAMESIDGVDAWGTGTSISRPSLMDTILISGGRKDKIRPGDILGALTGEAGGLDGSEVGKIEIHDRLSFVAISKEFSAAAAKSLNAGQIKGQRFRATVMR
jgi:ATP-independent RNA helicase DbpA